MTVPVIGMTCAACASSVENVLSKQEGVLECAVNFANESAQIAFDPYQTTPENLKKLLQAVGYDLILDTENASIKQAEIKTNHYQSLKKRVFWASVLTLPVVIIGMFFMNMPYVSWLMLLLTTPVLAVFGRGVFVNAWKQARYRKANMDTLVALSTGIAYMFSIFNTLNPDFWHSLGLHAHVYYEAAAVVIVFIMLGKLLEERAKANTSSAIKKLMGLQPRTVWVIENGEEREIPISEVRVGDRIIVKPGDKIAVDGKVLSGVSFVDESTLSGEPIPVEKSKGHKLYAGTVNQQGSFRFLAEKVGSETLLAQIISMVQHAQGSKAPIQKLTDKIAGIFVPVEVVYFSGTVNLSGFYNNCSRNFQGFGSPATNAFSFGYNKFQCTRRFRYVRHLHLKMRHLQVIPPLSGSTMTQQRHCHRDRQPDSYWA